MTFLVLVAIVVMLTVGVWLLYRALGLSSDDSSRCKHCQTRIDRQDAKYCPRCGRPVGSERQS